MTQPTTPERKLTAIMFTDIVGYTALMGKDERRARELLEKQREALYPVVEKHEGRVLKEIGDGTLSMFGSDIKAVDCAIELQKMLKNVEGLKLRIGIHVGDVVIEHDDVFGDGVNVASRIEPLAEPGGICVSGRVYDDIRNQPGMTAVSVGRKKLKNVQRPVEVFALSCEGLPSPGVRRRFLQRPAVRRGFASVAAVLTVAIIYILVIQGREPLYGDVPSVGILYLENLGTEEDEYLSYGITEDLIIDLSKAGIIRISPMKDILSYKGSDLSLSEIARSLRVRYVLTGSLRKEVESFRLAVQLIEPASGRTLWGDRWEEPVSEVSAIKGKMIGEVIVALGLTPNAEAAKEIQEKPTENADAYEFYLKGKYRFDHRETKEDLEVARGLLERAIELDTTFVHPRIKLGRSYEEVGENDRAMAIYGAALALAERHGSLIDMASALRGIGRVQLNRNNYDAALDSFNRSHAISEELGDRMGVSKTLNNIGIIYFFRGEYDKALEFYNRSLAIKQELENRRGEAINLGNIGNIYKNRGEYDKALEFYNRSLAIKQELKDRFGEGLWLGNIGDIYHYRGEYDKALEFYNRSLTITQELGDQEGQGWSHWGMGKVYYSEQEYTDAIKNLEKAVELFERIGAEADLLEPLSYLPLCKARIGEPDLALTIALKLEEQIGLVEAEAVEPIIPWNVSQFYSETGKPEKAEEYLVRAYKEVMRRAEEMKNEDNRKSFLTNVPVNKEIIAAWEKQSK